MCAYSVFNTFPVYPLSAKPLILLAFCRYRYHTSLFIEPDYYPDYAENEDVAPAAAPAPAIPGRDESDTAPKTADAPILPTLLLVALSVLVLVRAKKRLCR